MPEETAGLAQAPAEAPAAPSISPGAPDGVVPPSAPPEIKGPPDRSADRRALIEKAVKASSEKRDGKPPAASQAATGEPATNAAGRKIDPASGRYIKADGTLGEQAPAAIPAQAARAYPKSWKPELQPHWEKLSPEILDQIEKREQDIFKGIEEYKKQAMPADVKAVLAPYEQTFAQQYGGTAQGLSRLFELSNFASSKPEEFIRWFAAQRGINLNQAPADPNAPQADPQFTALQAELAGLKQQVGTFRQNAEQAAMAPYLSEVERFKGEAGHEHFEELRPAMHALISSGSAKTLQEAYEQAYRAHPTHGQTWLATQLAEKQKADAFAAQQARAAAVQVKGAPSQSSPPPLDPKNRRAVIEAAVRNSGRPTN